MQSEKPYKRDLGKANEIIDKLSDNSKDIDKVQQNQLMEEFAVWFDIICNKLPPGPAFIPQRYYVNFHKGSMPFLILGMMIYFNNYSLACWVYLSLHGSYGLIWLLKDFTFPDDSFQQPCTFLSFLIPWLVVIQPYCYGAYLLASGQAPQNPSSERICLCVMMYNFGIVLMMGADGQKYFTLRVKKGLLNDGFMKWSRNPNYVGEMMIYGSFALLVQRWEPWIVLGYMWSLIFLSRMAIKDYRLSKKQGWKDYKENSWMLLFKFGGNQYLAFSVYGIISVIAIFILSNGGIQNSVYYILGNKPINS